MKYLLTYTIFLYTILGMAQNTSLFEQGTAQYKEGKFQEAISLWTQVLDNGEQSAALYYNLGNANYKLNKVGPSVYYYEKALQLAPNDRDIKNNLKFAENTRIDTIEALPKSIFAKWNDALASIFNYNQWAIAAVICSMLFVLLFLLYYFSYSERSKRSYFVGSMLSVLAVITSLSMAYKIFSEVENDKPAIIFSEKTQVNSEPNLGSEPAFTLHEGTKVQILEIDDDWLRIQLADGKDGWVPSSDLKML